VIQRGPVLRGPGPASVDDGDHAQHLVPEPGDGDHPVAAVERRRLGDDGPDQLLALRRRGLGIGVGLTRAGPGDERAEAVLDGHRVTRQLVERAGDPVRAFAGDRHLGQPRLDVQAVLEHIPRVVGGGRRPLQRQVGRAQILRRRSLPRRGVLLLPVETGVGQGARGQPGQEAEQHLLRRRGLRFGRRHQQTRAVAVPGERVGPRPAHGRRPEPSAGGSEGGELRLQLWEVRDGRRLGPPGLAQTDGRVTCRRDRGPYPAQHLRLIACTGQARCQLEQAAPRGRPMAG
jgi:hypothetical protein